MNYLAQREGREETERNRFPLFRISSLWWSTLRLGVSFPLRGGAPSDTRIAHLFIICADILVFLRHLLCRLRGGNLKRETAANASE